MTSDSQPGGDRQAHAVPLEDLPEGVTAIQFPEKGCSLKEMSAFFGTIESSLQEACGEQ
ncbi:MAG: hypothetical protein K6E40_15320 [Desulfovibrio sp.]|nr:hypothetical protein [Desulfovibrio sp.]